MLAVGGNSDENRRTVERAHEIDAVWAGVGHYPTEESSPDLEAIRAFATDPRVVAIGEIGLDLEHGSVERTEQMSRLESLFAIALEFDLPVSIHNRGATAEVAELIGAHAGVRGAMHYFALGWDEIGRASCRDRA